MVFRAAHSVAEPSLWRGMSSSSASYAIGDQVGARPRRRRRRQLAGGGSFDDGSFGGSEGAAPTPAGIDGAIAEEDEGEDASPAK